MTVTPFKVEKGGGLDEIGYIRIRFRRDGSLNFADENLRNVPISQICLAGYMWDEMIQKLVAKLPEPPPWPLFPPDNLA